jgi:cytochrome c-type biogenesis protein CcmH
MTRPAAIATGIALVLSALLTVPAPAQEPRASLPDIEDEVMCTICGTLLAESQSPQADRERALIRRLIAEGQDKDQIKDALLAEYGPRVLATPSGHGFDLVAWIVPILGLLLGVGALTFGVLRLRRRSAQGRKPLPDLDPADAARLSEDIATYDR